MEMATAETGDADIWVLSRAPRWVSHEAAWVTAPCTDSLSLIKNHILYKGPDDPNARPLKLHIQRTVHRRVNQGQRFYFLTMWMGEGDGAQVLTLFTMRSENKS